MRYARLWVLIAVFPAIAAGALGYLQVRSQPKTYSASASLYVQQPASSGVGISGVQDIYASSQLAQTYSQLAVQPVVQAEADRLLAKQYPGYRVEDHGLQSAPINLQQASPLIVLSITDTIPKRAADAVNAVSKAFITEVTQFNQSRFAADDQALTVQISKQRDRINNLLAQISRYSGASSGLDSLRTALSAYQSTYQALITSQQQLRIERDISSSTVNIYSAATPPVSPTGPHPSRTALTWAILALLAGTALVYGYEYLSDLPGSPEEVSEMAGAPVLATIPVVRGRRARRRLIEEGRAQPLDDEGYRLVRTNVQFASVDQPPRTLLITSALPGEGKTTTASNLALAFAEGGRSVVLVDGDLRRPSVHRLFDAPSGHGLTELIFTIHQNGRRPGHQVYRNLSVIPAGPLPPNPADILGSERMGTVIDRLNSQADIVILDAPPVLAASDAAILSTMVDGVILVVDLHKTKRREIRRAREAIEAVNGRIMGVVVNRFKVRDRSYYYEYADKYRAKGGTVVPPAIPDPELSAVSVASGVPSERQPDGGPTD
jgi:non-specific protein-tyrosine kinase